jgi:type I restriction enzyme S subunit
MSKLPQGWTRATLGQIIELKYGKALPERERSGQGYPVYGSNGVVGHHQKALTSGVTIIVGRKGSVGEVNFSRTSCSPIDTTYYVDEFPFENPKYWFYKLKQLDLGSLNKSTAIPGFNRADAYSLPIQLPPQPEQKRIADKLDTVLARVDACRERLNRVPLILKRFRQSVLAAATTGQLTADWREEKKAKLIPAKGVSIRNSFTPLKEDEMPWEISTDWKWVHIEEICAFITKGTTPPKDRMSSGSGEVPYIKVYNLTFDGRINFTINPSFIDSQTHQHDLKRSIVLPGDVLMNIVGPPLGKVSVVPDDFPQWNINQAIARFRPTSCVSSSYLAICMMTSRLISYASRQAKATAGQFNLTLEICRNLPIPLPDVEEQRAIVHRVETLFAFADRLEARLTTARATVEQLTPALLAKAFRGELVPQDPNDEPAAELLKRLAAAREPVSKGKRRSKSSDVPERCTQPDNITSLAADES